MSDAIPSTRVVIVDDHPSIVQCLSQILGEEPDLEVVGSARTAAQAAAIIADVHPDVAILDITLSEEVGLGWIAKLMSRFPKLKVILHSMHSGQDMLRNALQMQVGGYVLKSSDPRSVVYAIRSVRLGGTYVDPVLMSQALARGLGSGYGAGRLGEDEPKVSPREMDTLRLTALGYGIKEIASEFKLSPKSIETYKLRAAEKLGLKTRSAIVRYAIANGWFSTLD